MIPLDMLIILSDCKWVPWRISLAKLLCKGIRTGEIDKSETHWTGLCEGTECPWGAESKGIGYDWCGEVQGDDECPGTGYSYCSCKSWTTTSGMLTHFLPLLFFTCPLFESGQLALVVWQVEMLKALGLHSTLITDGRSPINLLNAVEGLIGGVSSHSIPPIP